MRDYAGRKKTRYGHSCDSLDRNAAHISPDSPLAVAGLLDSPRAAAAAGKADVMADRLMEAGHV